MMATAFFGRVFAASAAAAACGRGCSQRARGLAAPRGVWLQWRQWGGNTARPSSGARVGASPPPGAPRPRPPLTTRPAAPPGPRRQSSRVVVASADEHSSTEDTMASLERKMESAARAMSSAERAVASVERIMASVERVNRMPSAASGRVMPSVERVIAALTAPAAPPVSVAGTGGGPLGGRRGASPLMGGRRPRLRVMLVYICKWRCAGPPPPFSSRGQLKITSLIDPRAMH